MQHIRALNAPVEVHFLGEVVAAPVAWVDVISGQVCPEDTKQGVRKAVTLRT